MRGKHQRTCLEFFQSSWSSWIGSRLPGIVGDLGGDFDQVPGTKGECTSYLTWIPSLNERFTKPRKDVGRYMSNSRLFQCFQPWFGCRRANANVSGFLNGPETQNADMLIFLLEQFWIRGSTIWIYLDAFHIFAHRLELSTPRLMLLKIAADLHVL